MSEAPPLRSSRGLLVGLGLVVIAGAIGAATLLRGGGERGEAVRTAVVERRAITQKVLAQGKVRARTQVEVASEIGGRVNVVNVAVGDVVKQGDPLFSLDDEQLKNAVDQLRVALAGSEAMLKRAELALQEAERGVDRDKRLKEKGVVADEQLKLSESRLQLARADLDQAKAGIERTRLDLQRARDALRRARVTAPIAGTVVAVGVEVGQVVSAVQGLTAGTEGMGLGFGASASGPSAPVVIADLAELIVKLDVDELDVGLVKQGQKAVVTAQGLKDMTFAGVVERVGLMGRDQAGAVLFVVEVGVTDPGAREVLRSGMSAQADIEVQKLDDVHVVPVAAVLEGDGKEKADRVFAWEGDGVTGVAREVAVKLGPTEGDTIAILSGLTDNQKVIEGPFRALRALEDGDRVVQATAEASAGKGAARDAGKKESGQKDAK